MKTKKKVQQLCFRLLLRCESLRGNIFSTKHRNKTILGNFTTGKSLEYSAQNLSTCYCANVSVRMFGIFLWEFDMNYCY